ncbi:MAG: ribulose bisphosphate carboxylase small subunit, partial [Alphaproteobacteria bacterium]|nr:ribulose bisphosphate carboxylase small subunit [Alphaproteobacteria bacterium]
AEVEECGKAWPNHLVRLIGYDNYAQSQGASMVVRRPGG